MHAEPGTDYYFENGLMVMTAHYLKRRGFCCGNGCRHCPYGEEIQAQARSSGRPVAATPVAEEQAASDDNKTPGGN